jgi:hypothetical protein
VEKDNHYISLQKGFVDKGFLATLSDKAVRVYIALCSFKDWHTGNCWPTIAKISEVTGLHRETVIKANQELERNGLIKTWRNKKEWERTYKKFYRINPIEADMSPVGPERYRKRHGTVGLDEYRPKRDERGRFLKSESGENGPGKSVVTGLGESGATGQKLILLNKSQRTTKETSSFKDERDEETIRELIQLKGKRFVKNELKKSGRNPTLVDKIES